jgi:hypothetical protein
MPPVERASLVGFLFAVVVFFAMPCFAQNTIHVPADQPTIQGAINAANNGDTVLIAPGTYYENINFMGKAITVTSSSGAVSQTIIDGGKKGNVVTFNNSEGPNSVIGGLTLQNGSDVSNSALGGGIFVGSASPTIIGNLIQNNTTCSGGAGIFVYFSSPVIRGNIIRNNYSAQCSGVIGGGIYLVGSGSAQIIGNSITDNSTAPSGMGGGIGLNGSGTPVIKNNTITRNIAGNGSEGGGVWINAAQATIAQNLIYNNSADQGGGIHIFSGDPGLLILSNTIVNNSVASSSPLGSAIYAARGLSSQLTDNLLVGPLTQGAPYSAVYCESNDQPIPVFVSNDAFTPNGVGFSGACGGQIGQNGNISADPLFMDPAGDFRLRLASPAIDAGTNSAPNLPQSDFAGNPRILDGNNDCISTVDMGAYEAQLGIASVSFSPNSVTFAGQVPGTSSSPQSVTLSNTGAACFQFSGIGVAGDFSQTNTCSAAGLRGGTSCSFNVTFTPTALGTRLGNLDISGSDGISPASASVSLSGLGVDFFLFPSGNGFTVKHGQSIQITISVSPNSGPFNFPVALSCSGLPTKSSCALSPSSVIPGNNGATSVMTVSTAGNTPRGSYNVLVVGKSGTDVHSTQVLVSVN